MDLKHTVPLTEETNIAKLSYIQGIILGLKMTAGKRVEQEMYDRAYRYTIDLLPIAAKADNEKK